MDEEEARGSIVGCSMEIRLQLTDWRGCAVPLGLDLSGEIAKLGVPALEIPRRDLRSSTEDLARV